MSEKKTIEKLSKEERKALYKEWREEAKKCKPENVAEFIGRLVNGYEHDYSSIVEAVSVAAVAGAYAVQNSPEGGLTGFQWSWAAGQVLLRMNYEHNKLGLCIKNYDNLLYPQYVRQFDGTDIEAKTAEMLREEARNRIKETKAGNKKYDLVSPSVLAWWKKLAAGEFPSWLRVNKERK